MPYESKYGREEGIAQRLVEWRRQMGSHSMPWLGTGLCEDLVTAARLLGADVSEFTVDANQPTLPEVIPAEPKMMEFDL